MLSEIPLFDFFNKNDHRLYHLTKTLSFSLWFHFSWFNRYDASLGVVSRILWHEKRRTLSQKSLKNVITSVQPGRSGLYWWWIAHSNVCFILLVPIYTIQFYTLFGFTNRLRLNMFSINMFYRSYFVSIELNNPYWKLYILLSMNMVH